MEWDELPVTIQIIYEGTSFYVKMTRESAEEFKERLVCFLNNPKSTEIRVLECILATNEKRAISSGTKIAILTGDIIRRSVVIFDGLHDD